MKIPVKSFFMIGLLVRVGLLVFGHIQDQVKSWSLSYTDVDYLVFSDAAKYVLEGKSPYDRTTYRYTPLMAYLVLGNHLISFMWGKVIFVALDLVCAILIK